MIARFLSASVAANVWLQASAASCPEPTRDLKSTRGGKKLSLTFNSEVDADVLVYWVSQGGEEVDVGLLTAHSGQTQNTMSGHVFRLYSATENRVMLLEHTVGNKEEEVFVRECDELAGAIAAEKERVTRTYENLVHDQKKPCPKNLPSSKWSCVRSVPEAEYKARSEKDYGFLDGSEAGGRAVGEQYDRGYVHHIHQVPRLTRGPGYLKMNFTEKMRDAVIDWYHKVKKTHMEVHPPIAGGYTNNHVQPFDKVNLDDHRDMWRLIWTEMKGVLEWWTGEKNLQHTSTFGVRIYRRDAMLINHVDRADTHLASAVIQVHQEADEDGGWPLEVCMGVGKCKEVYLQPGEMVLYEGGHIRHGRPMRFKGKEFANVFSHFAPQGWNGPGRSPAWEKRLASAKGKSEL